MKKYKLLQVLALASVMAMGQVAIAGNGPGKGRGAQQNVPVSVTLSNEEAAMLTFMREEEKLARDVYRVLFDQWNKRVFRNISNSEQRHMDSLAERLSYYQLSDPVVDDSTGAFVNRDLATAYLDLKERGMQSLEDAFRVGAYIKMPRATSAPNQGYHFFKGTGNTLMGFIPQLIFSNV